MRRRDGLLALLLGSLAVCACRGEIALSGPEGDGGLDSRTLEAGSNGSSSASGGSSSSTSSGGSTGSGTAGSGSSSGGPCAGIPAGSGSGSDGTPVLLAHVNSPSGIVVDATNAYVASYEIGPVYRVALDGSGSAVMLDAIGQNNVAINTTGVYTVAGGGGDVPQGIVVGCAKTGCNSQYTTLATGQNGVWGVAADDVNVYWTNQQDVGGIFEAPIGGGPAVMLSGAGPAGSVVANGGRVFYEGATTTTSPGFGETGVLTVSATGGPPTVLVPPNPNYNVVALTVDCVNVYYETTDGTIAQVPIGGGTPTTLVTGAGRGLLQLAVDSDRVYFGSTQGDVASVPIGGGAVTTLAPGAGSIGIAVDANNVYWTNRDEGTVMKLAK
ncbi:MAG TPA: hypothetical protein VIJ22_15460 [Polyangiaceae bacterium]